MTKQKGTKNKKEKREQKNRTSQNFLAIVRIFQTKRNAVKQMRMNIWVRIAPNMIDILAK